jgi:hypothetical protein
VLLFFLLPFSLELLFSLLQFFSLERLCVLLLPFSLELLFVYGGDALAAFFLRVAAAFLLRAAAAFSASAAALAAFLLRVLAAFLAASALLALEIAMIFLQKSYVLYGKSHTILRAI